MLGADWLSGGLPKDSVQVFWMDTPLLAASDVTHRPVDEVQRSIDNKPTRTTIQNIVFLDSRIAKRFFTIYDSTRTIFQMAPYATAG